MLVTTFCFLSIFSISLSQALTHCYGSAEYSKCSSNNECGCLQYSDTRDDSGICGLITLECSSMHSCASNGKTCHDQNHVCVRHPLCDYRPLCYPLNKATETTCPSSNKTETTTSLPTTSASFSQCDWTRDGVPLLNQLKGPTGLFLDDNNDDISIYIADSGNDRIVKWTPEQSMNSPLTIHINGTDQLSYPRDIVMNKTDGSMFICDKGNKRIVHWMNNSLNGQTFLSNVECESLAMDKQGSLIASELDKDRITKWEQTNGMFSSEKAVAGAYGKGSNLNQLNNPRNIILDEEDQAIYISDSDNHRIIKWIKGAKQGIVVAGGNGKGNGLHQLAHPRGIALHPNGDLYIADTSNNRIVRWRQQAASGTVIVQGDASEQAAEPFGLIFDQHYRNLYVTDWANSLFLRFFIDGMGNCATIT